MLNESGSQGVWQNRGTDSIPDVAATNWTSLQPQLLSSALCTADKVTARQEQRADFNIHTHSARHCFLQHSVFLLKVRKIFLFLSGC